MRKANRSHRASCASVSTREDYELISKRDLDTASSIRVSIRIEDVRDFDVERSREQQKKEFRAA